MRLIPESLPRVRRDTSASSSRIAAREEKKERKGGRLRRKRRGSGGEEEEEESCRIQYEAATATYQTSVGPHLLRFPSPKTASVPPTPPPPSPPPVRKTSADTRARARARHNAVNDDVRSTVFDGKVFHPANTTGSRKWIEFIPMHARARARDRRARHVGFNRGKEERWEGERGGKKREQQSRGSMTRRGFAYRTA